MTQVSDLATAKFDMVCAMRILERQKLTQWNAGHCSQVIGPGQMLVNRYGPSFATIRQRDLLTVDFEGNVIEGEGEVNCTIRLHGRIHKLNPECRILVHTHPPLTTMYSVFRRVPETYQQFNCILHGQIGVLHDDYEGLAGSDDRIDPIATAIKTYKAVILPNHGALTQGNTIQDALWHMLLLEETVRYNLFVHQVSSATGWTAAKVADSVALETQREIERVPVFSTFWLDLVQRLRTSDPDLFE